MKIRQASRLAVAAILAALGAHAAAVPGYESVLAGLVERRRDSRQLARLGSLDDRIALHQLDHASSLKVSPHVGLGPDGKPEAGLAAEIVKPRWMARGEVSGADASTAWAGFSLPLIRSAGKKRHRLDSLILLTDQLSRLEFQGAILLDFQEIALQRIKLLELEGQALLLDRGTRHLDTLLRTLQNLERNGKITASALEPLLTSRFRFDIRSRALRQESALLVHRISGTYDVPDSVFRELDVVLLAGVIEELRKGRTNKTAHIFQQIDSLGLKAKLDRAGLQTLNELDLWIGYSFGRMGQGGDPTPRIALDLNYRFDDSPFAVRKSPSGRSRTSPPDTPPIPDAAVLRDSIGGFRSNLESIESRVFQEIRFGSWESLFSFNEAVAEYYEQGLRLSMLDCDRLRAVLFQVRSFDDLPPAAAMQ